MSSGPTVDSNRLPSADQASRTQAMSALLAQNWWAVGLRGVFAVLFGLIALFSPGATLLSFALLFSVYMLVDGVCGIVAAVRAARKSERWGLLVLEGIANILVGLIALAWPGLTVLSFIIVLAAWSIITGVLMMVAAYRLTKAHGRGWLVFSGVVSLLFGVVLVIAPLAGAVVLTWWLGAYAIAFGVTLLVLAFKLKSRKDEGAAAAAATPA